MEQNGPLQVLGQVGSSVPFAHYNPAAAKPNPCTLVSRQTSPHLPL